jgi:hypothetical protein
MANFVTIQYQLLLQRVPAIHQFHPSPGNGYWHRKNQFGVEAETMFNQNQIGATITLFLIDLIDGKVTEGEKQHMRKYLLNIMKHAERPYKGGDNVQHQERGKDTILQ